MAEPILVTSEKSSQDLGAQGLELRPTFVENAVESPVAASAACEGCGKHHGSVGQELRCLRLELRRKRLAIVRLEDESETRVSDVLVQSPACPPTKPTT